MTFKERKLHCQACAPDTVVKALLWDTDPTPPCATCGKPLSQLEWTSGASASVIGDECDVTVYHGICNPDGSPRRYRSKSEMRQVARALGLTNAVEHCGSPGSDKSPHTSRWV